MKCPNEGYKFHCTTKFNVGDIAYMRLKLETGKVVKKGPIKIVGIELRVDSKGKMVVWYNCDSANRYKCVFHAKGSKHYVKENELYTEAEIDESGWDVESTGYTDYYNPDGSHKTEEEEREAVLQRWKDAGYPNARIEVYPNGRGWGINLGKED